jgi:hypothetical protein
MEITGFLLGATWQGLVLRFLVAGFFSPQEAGGLRNGAISSRTRLSMVFCAFRQLYQIDTWLSFSPEKIVAIQASGLAGSSSGMWID